MPMKKFAIIIVTISLILILFDKIAKVFSPGSYPYSEIYEVNMNDSLLIEKIESFKQSYPSYKAPIKSELVDDAYGKDSNRFILYFYYKEENQILLTWVRRIDSENSQFAISSVNDGVELGKWKELNNYFGFFETRKEREKFEDRILKPLEVTYSRKSLF